MLFFALLGYSEGTEIRFEQVPLDWTSCCHFGGERPWWKCPSCDRRCAVLYLIGSYPFRCRISAALTYTTSQGGEFTRTMQEVRKGREEARLGDR